MKIRQIIFGIVLFLESGILGIQAQEAVLEASRHVPGIRQGSGTEVHQSYGGSATVTDIEGNTYKTILIGSQVWMAENLKTTRYNNFTVIPSEADNSYGDSISVPGYCWYYFHEESNKNTYGTLYNWHAVETGRLCPAGWHVPTDDEWKQLEIFLGMLHNEADSSGYRGNNKGGKLMSKEYLWFDNKDATNESGFNALPAGGFSHYLNGFTGLHTGTAWWSSSEYNHGLAWYRSIISSQSDILRYPGDKRDGLSVRCIKDN